MNPACNADLFYFFDSGEVASVEELAHVIGIKPSGPRGQDSLPLSKRDEYENIILLCPTCHTAVDKVPKEFPPSLLHQWKSDHQHRLTSIFSVPTFPTRDLLSIEVKALLRRNKSLFDAYGPHSTEGANPVDPRAVTWARYVKSDIIPNNRRVLRCLLKNQKLLTDTEICIVEHFRLHCEALEYNHLSGDKTADAPLFPIAMNRLLQ
jgi:hypothetical protein